MKVQSRKRFGACALVAALWAASPAHGSDELFVEAGRSGGLDFVHFNGMVGEFYLPEITGHGGALFDYDNDGDLDVYLVQGATFGDEKPVTPWAGKTAPTDRLFRNEGSLKFTDVTERAGIEAKGYGMGVATADIDNDGDVDLYVTNLGANELYINNGDGSFRKVAKAGGADCDEWSTSAAFIDFDHDGFLDLYVANYVAFNRAIKQPRCFATSSARDWCGPDAYPPLADRFYHNRGDGSFEDWSARTGIAALTGAGLGVVTGDFNNDGWLDLFVANDGDANFLWINQKDGSFSDEALWAGVAVNGAGKCEASMGVGAGDFDNDGDEDLFMTHLMGETNTLYVNQGTTMFEDRTAPAGLSASSLPFTSFGTSWVDFDNDGWLDLLILSGAVRTLDDRARSGDPYPLDQRNQLFRNIKGQFIEVKDRLGPSFKRLDVSRGGVFGDIDNDGDTDVVVCNNNGQTQLLVNQSGQQSNWIGLGVHNPAVKRDALGAAVDVVTSSGRVIHRRVRTDGSYCSSNDPRIIVGLGSESVQQVRVFWPISGTTEVYTSLKHNQYSVLVKGQGSEMK